MNFKFIFSILFISGVAQAEQTPSCAKLIGKYSKCSVVTNSGGWKADSVEVKQTNQDLSYTEISFGVSDTKSNSNGVVNGISDYLGEVYHITKITCDKDMLVIKEKTWMKSWGPTEPTDQEASNEGLAELNIIKVSRLTSEKIKVIRNAEQNDSANIQSFICQKISIK